MIATRVNFRVNSQGKCPHCLTLVRFVPADSSHSGSKGTMNITWRVAADKAGTSLMLHTSSCPACGKVILTCDILEQGKGKPVGTYTLWPRLEYRPVPDEVPTHIAEDYKEAVATLSISPKASAALSRRCLQTILVEKGGVKKHQLAQQIDEVLPHLPAYIAESIDAIRNIGNFAAHPQKSLSSGEIVEVEPGESEWTLEVLDLLFDHYYVKPAVAKTRRAALDAKLSEVGKPPMK